MEKDLKLEKAIISAITDYLNDNAEMGYNKFDENLHLDDGREIHVTGFYIRSGEWDTDFDNGTGAYQNEGFTFQLDSISLVDDESYDETDISDIVDIYDITDTVEFNMNEE